MTALPILPDARPLRSSTLGLASSLPWCCVLPVALGLLGFASSISAGWLGSEMPVLLVASAAFFGRAHYLLWARRRGSTAARAITVLLTLVAFGLWAFRLWPLLRPLVSGAA